MINKQNNSGDSDGVDRQEEVFNEAELQEVFQLRQKFNARVYGVQAGQLRENFADFVRAWTRLPQELRVQAEQNYRQGYEELVRAGVEAMKNRDESFGR